MNAFQTGNFPQGRSSIAVGGFRLPMIASLMADPNHTGALSRALGA